MEYIFNKNSARGNVMIKTKTQKTWIGNFELLLKCGNMLKSVPLRFNGKVQFVEKSSTLLFIWVILLLGSLDCGYRAWTISSRPMDEFSIYSLINEMGNLVSRTATIIVGWELVFRKKQYAIFLNSLVKLDFDLKRKFGESTTSQKYQDLSRFVYVAVIFSVISPIVGALPQQIKDRHHRQYWGSQLLDRSVYDHTIDQKLLTITVPISIQLEIFSSLKILNIFLNEIAAPVLWPTFENALLAIQVIVHVTIIRFLDNVQPSFILTVEIVLVMAMILQGKCMKSGAKMLVISSQFKKNVRRFGNKFEKKVAKSLHPLRVEVGSFYYFKTSTFTTFLQTHVDTTINWLLTLR
ncbi:hypothetical protein Fcan01_15557 [Folsomia candida]|uniref:Uncharacterized protein n=1 Tax=Folsomia candida TaxID=158441 RepID=A0A226DXR3_FOLCA|nr:hypothetical protein Fcan01_15557 [Folsomia candida]